MNLLTLPCAGASATMYMPWRRLLPSWIHVQPLELPGRGRRLDEACIVNFNRLVAHLCDEYAEHMQGRYAFFGHSMGALLAYGMTLRQIMLGRPLPQAVFASASPAPSRQDPDRFADKNDDLSLIADLRRQGGTPDAIFKNNELLRMTLDILDADYQVCASFQYAPLNKLSMPLHVLAGRKDDIAKERMQAWQNEASNAFTLTWFDGGHFFIQQQEEQVLATIARELKR